ncbi:MAG: M3 family oligoendopeptidase [Planctomycetes bacterium]|nr:M3 family oligoendopeptidase [Planctomycetota bacterium]
MATDTLEQLPKQYPRAFVPADLIVRGFEDVRALYDQLLEAELNTGEELEQWMLQRSELESVIQEVASRIYIRSTVDTTNLDYKQAFLDWVEDVEPRIKPISHKLNVKFRDCPARDQLDKSVYGIYERNVLTALELFSEKNVPLETELSKLTNKYEEIQGGITIEFQGEQRTPQQMAKYQLEPDRAVREAAWRATSERRLTEGPKLDELFDKQLRLREQVATNAGLKSFRDFQFKSFLRFDYTPADCDKFANAVETVALPAVERVLARRRKDMKLEKLRPWDTSVDPLGRGPLKPFEDVEELKAGCSRIFHKVDGELGAQFDNMRNLGLLDLDNRRGKAPGGYQSTLDEVRLPFIFMNAVGIDGDLRTLLHEGGHAFHAYAAANQPLMQYRSAPMEFCEVASMSMELLGLPHMDEFYKGEDLQRARREFLEGIIEYFPWYAIIDQFQHWVYTNPGSTIAQREDKWLALNERFSAGVDWSGLEQYRRNGWQRIGHMFFAPFYFIEYAIAQIGALQVWLNSKHNGPKALEQYRHALSLGGSKTLPELFKAAGGRFGMGADTVRPLIDALEEELAAL